jgi:hypothetical protein
MVVFPEIATNLRSLPSHSSLQSILLLFYSFFAVLTAFFMPLTLCYQRRGKVMNTNSKAGSPWKKSIVFGLAIMSVFVFSSITFSTPVLADTVSTISNHNSPVFNASGFTISATFTDPEGIQSIKVWGKSNPGSSGVGNWVSFSDAYNNSNMVGMGSGTEYRIDITPLGGPVPLADMDGAAGYYF